jgi:hypothetical protein
LAHKVVIPSVFDSVQKWDNPQKTVKNVPSPPKKEYEGNLRRKCDLSSQNTMRTVTKKPVMLKV